MLDTFNRKTLLKGIHHFIHTNLAIALLLALIVFVSGIETARDSDVRMPHYSLAIVIPLTYLCHRLHVQW